MQILSDIKQLEHLHELYLSRSNQLKEIENSCQSLERSQLLILEKLKWTETEPDTVGLIIACDAEHTKIFELEA